MFNFASKLLAFVLIVQISTSQQNEQSSLLRCLTGYKDRNGKLSDCPPDRVLSKCISKCPKTCQNPYIKSNNKDCLYNCRSGCVCANGTLIDEGQNRKCVPQDECTCLHNGKVFMPAEILLQNGKKCQCKNGGWICNDQPMSSRTCSVVGLTHLETFDGSLLNVKPGNYLLVKNIDETKKNFRIEASVQKNFKRQLKFTNGNNTVILSDIHTIKLNNNKIEQLPHETTDLIIRQATSHFILIELKYMTIAYDGNAVYITLESFYQERVRGLCGSFDYNQDNDLYLPNCKLTCDTNVFSQAYLINDTKPGASSEENVPEKFDRPKAEKYCHGIKNNVCKIGAYAHGLLLSCIEDQRFIQIDNNTRASCYWHSIFAHACALTGYDLPQKYTKWRGECESIFGKCGAGTIYEECPVSCLNLCGNRDNEHELNSVCRQQCLAGCVCTKNTYYDTNENRSEPLKCKKVSECSCFDEQTKSYHQSGSIIKRGQCSTCICLHGQFKCNSDKCKKSKIICPNNLIFTEKSLASCPKTCSNHLIWKNCHRYRSGCDCPTNMIRDKNTNRCVYPKHCSCKLKDKIFPYGSKVTKDCNECTCASGQWSCTQLDCSHTCSILRNRYYTTFSGQYLQINSGSCAYTAARFREDAKQFALTLSDSVPTEYVHSLQGQLTIDGVNISFESGKSIRVNNQALTTLTSSPARYSTFTIYKAGLFVVINGTHFILRWDYGNRIYLTIDNRWKGKLDGVCSEHDRVSQGIIKLKDKHVDVWKVNSKCKVERSKPNDGNEKWRWAHERCVAILNGSSSTKNPFSSCLDKVSKERRKTLYTQCMDETCSCVIDTNDCPSICSWFASLSEICRKHGYPIESWRHNEFCPLVCEENEEYKSCGTLCQKTCNDLDNKSTMKCYNDTCNEGCYCKEGYVLNNNGDCVKPQQCSEKTTKRPSSTTRSSNESVTTGTRSSTTSASSISTTLVTCTEIELVETLVTSNLIQIRPVDLSNKQDLISKGLDFSSNVSSLEIDLPKRGAIVRDVKLSSKNIAEIEVIFVLESGRKTSPIRGSPSALPNDEFPTEKVLDITINILETNDNGLPQDVTLSVIVCDEDLPTTTTEATTLASVTETTPESDNTSASTVPSGSTDTTEVTLSTIGSTLSSGPTTTIGTQPTTTPTFCEEMEYIDTLIATNSVEVQPNDIPNKQDLIKTGVDFPNEDTSFLIDIPTGGAIVRQIYVYSSNVAEIEVTFTTESGDEVAPIQGAPTSLPTDDFPTETVTEIVIKVTKTTDNNGPKDVTLSVIACAESTTPSSSTGTPGPSSSTAETTEGTPGPTESVETTTGPGASTTAATPSSSTGTPRPSSSTAETTEGTPGPTESVETTTGPGASTTAATPGSSGPVETTTGSDTSTPAGTSGSSGPGETTTGPGATSTSGTSGPSGPGITTTEGTSASSGPSGSTTAGTPGPSSPVETTTAGTAGPSSGSVGTTSSAPETTTGNFCEEMEYINTLIATNSVEVQPNDIPNKQDLITTGVDFPNEETSFLIDIPTGGAIVRQIYVYSSNVAEIEVTFTTESGDEVAPIQGAPTSLPTDDFPTETVTEIVIKVTKTTDNNGPKDVTLSVIACAGGSTPSSSTGTPGPSSSTAETTEGTLGPTESVETTTGPGASTTAGTPGSSGTSGPGITTTEETLGSSGPGESTTAGTPGPSSSVETTTASTVGPSSGSVGTTSSAPETTTGNFCEEMEYINTLIATNSVEVQPNDIPNKQDLITTGVDFPNEETSFLIDIPTGGAIVRQIYVYSSNVAEIEVTFTTESGDEVAPIQGAPTSLPTDEFPTETVTEIVIKVTKTTDNNGPKDVTLSVIACAEGTTPSSSTGTPGPSSSTAETTEGTSGPSESVETTTVPGASTTAATPGSSGPVETTTGSGTSTPAGTSGSFGPGETTTGPGAISTSGSPGPSGPGVTTTEGTLGSSGPGGSTTAGTPGPSSPVETTTGPGASTTAGTPGPSGTSGPGVTTTEETLGSSGPGGSTTAGTPGPSSPVETTTGLGATSTSGTSGPGVTTTEETSASSGPSGSTTAGTPGPSSPVETTTAGTAGPSSGSVGTTSSAPETTTGNFCEEMEYINTLIATNSVEVQPNDIPNKQDLITTGVDFPNEETSFLIDIPTGGAIVRQIYVYSSNVAEIEVTFTTESGDEVAPIQGAPTSLPTDEFPTETVTKIVIKVTKTTDNNGPKDVTLSVIACAEGSTPSSSTGTPGPSSSTAETTEGTLGPTESVETTTGLGASTTAGISAPSSPAQSSTAGTPQSSQGSPETTSSAPETTTGTICEEMEYINTLIATNSVEVQPNDIPNKQDLITTGVDFPNEETSFLIDIPTGGAIVRQIYVYSSNVAEIEVTFTTVSGSDVAPIQGAPTSLPKDEFPTEKVTEIVIKVTKTTDNNGPNDVTLSVIACAEGTTPSSSAGTPGPSSSTTTLTTTEETPAPSGPVGTNTGPGASTTQATSGSSGPGVTTTAGTPGPSGPGETTTGPSASTTQGTSASSGPGVSTTEATPGTSGTGETTTGLGASTTQGTSGSSGPSVSSTEGTPGPSGPGETTTGPGASTTQGTSGSSGPGETTSGPGKTTSGPGETTSGPGASTTEGTPGSSTPGETTTGTGPSTTGGTSGSSGPVETTSGPGASTTQGTPGPSGPSVSSTEGTSGSSGPGETTTETGPSTTGGTSGSSGPGETTTETGPSTTEGTSGSSGPVETTTGPGASTTEGTPGSSTPGETTTGTGPSTTEATSGSSGPVETTSGPGASTTQGTPGPSGPSVSSTEGTSGSSGPGETTSGTGPSTTEGTSGSSGPSVSSTEGTPGPSTAGDTTTGTGPSTTQGPSGSSGPGETTSGTGPSTTEGTSGSSGPSVSSTEGTPAPSTAEDTTTGTGPSTTQAQSGSSGPGETTSGPGETRTGPGASSTEGAPGPSGPAETTTGPGASTTQGTSGSSGPSVSSTEGTPGPSTAGDTTTGTGPSTTQGPSGSSGPGETTSGPGETTTGSGPSSTEGTTGPSGPTETTSGPGGSTTQVTPGPSGPSVSSTEGTPGPSTPGETTTGTGPSTTQGPSGSSGPSETTSGPGETTTGPGPSSTEGTPGPSGPTETTTAPGASTTQGTSGSSGPSVSTTEETPGPSTAGETTTGTGPSTTPGTSGSSGPSVSSTEGTPGSSGAGETTSGPGETTTGPGASTTEGTPGSSTPGETTTGTGPSTTEGTSGSSGPGETTTGTGPSTTEGTPGSSTPSETTTGTGPSTTEGTSGSSGPVETTSGPGASTTQGTPGPSGPSVSSTEGTSGSSGPGETTTGTGPSTTEGTPGSSTPGETTTGTGPSTTEGTSGSSGPVETTSGPGASTTQGTPRPSGPVETTSGPGASTTQGTPGPSGPSVSSTEGTSGSSGPGETTTGTGPSTTEGTPGSSTPSETTTGTGPSTTEGTSGSSGPVETTSGPGASTTQGTPGPSGPSVSSTEGTSGSSGPGETTTGTGPSTTEGTPGSSTPGETTTGTGPRTTEGTSGSSGPVETTSGPGASTTQGTPRPSGPGETTSGTGSSTTEGAPGPSGPAETTTAPGASTTPGTSGSSGPSVSTTEETPGPSTAGETTTGTGPSTTPGTSGSSGPSVSTTEGTPGPSTPGETTTGTGPSTTQGASGSSGPGETTSGAGETTTGPGPSSTEGTTGPSGPAETTTAPGASTTPGTSGSSGPSFSTTEGTPGPSTPGETTTGTGPSTTQGPSESSGPGETTTVPGASTTERTSGSSGPSVSPTEVTPGSSGPGETTSGPGETITGPGASTTQGTSGSSGPDISTTAGSPGPSGPGVTTKGATTTELSEGRRITTQASNISSQSTSSYPFTKTTRKPQLSTTPSNVCEDEIALITEQINGENSSSIPRYFVKPITPYNPTDVNPGERGVSFSSSDKAYIIIFPISPAAIINSVRLPKTTNVDQIRVMFLDEQDKPIAAQPSDNAPLQITSKLENSPIVNVNFPTKVNAVHITLIHTSDNQPPQGVTVEIMVCVEPLTTTQQYTVTTSQTNVSTSKTVTTPASNYTSQTIITTSKTVTSPGSNNTSPPSSPSGSCTPKQHSPALIIIGECISQQEIQQESCAGYCPSHEELDPVSGDISEKECLCCAPDSTYTESILMNCPNATTGQNEQQTSSIVRIRSCKCSMCLGAPKISSSNDMSASETYDKTNRSKAKTKTRRR